MVTGGTLAALWTTDPEPESVAAMRRGDTYRSLVWPAGNTGRLLLRRRARVAARRKYLNFANDLTSAIVERPFLGDAGITPRMCRL
jgi:hypothetical protein